MKLDEYRQEIEKFEANIPQDAPGHPGASRAMILTLKRELDNALWQPGYKQDARELSARASAIAYRL